MVRRLVLNLQGLARDPDQLERYLDSLTEALESSPVPASEWKPVIDMLGVEMVTRLLGISPASVRRYARAVRSTPDDVAARLHWLALTVGDLARAYNEIGIRQWFDRKRVPPGLPFLWETDDQPPGRWHGPGEGPAHYLADTPDGAWAEFLRHEGITHPEELRGIDRAIWAVEVPNDLVAAPREPELPPEILVGGLESYDACRGEARRLRRGGAEAIRVTLFGPGPDLIGWRVVESGRPGPDLLPRVRPLAP